MRLGACRNAIVVAVIASSTLLADFAVRAQSTNPAAGSKANGTKPPLSAADQTIKDAFAKSKTAAKLDDYTEIITLCQDGIDKGAIPENTAYAKKLQGWAYNRRGEKRAESGDDKQALKDFELAMRLDPTLWKAIQNHGVSKASLGDTKDALDDFNAVIKANPKYANAWYNRGELKYEEGDFNGAVQDYNQALMLEPGDPGFYNSRGHALYRLQRFREALNDYNQAVRIDPNDAAALVNRGDAFRDLGQYPQAAADYREAVRINPKLGRAYLSTAWLMATCADSRFRDPDKAVSAAQRAIDLDGDTDYRYLDTLAAAQANAGRFDDAKATAAKAVKAAPASEVSHVRQHLDLFENNKAYREGAPAEPVRSASRPQ
ncbi:MAG TPA: tetratricopeptide repeat protein [Pirellulales bacterium]